MKQLTIMVRYEPQATPLDDSSGFEVESRKGEITLLEGESNTAPRETSYQSRVTMTGQTTFTEDGTLAFRGPDGFLHFTTVGEGVMEPSAQEGALQGSVIWRLAGGEGRYAGASGLVASTFVFEPDVPASRELQIIRLFLPN